MSDKKENRKNNSGKSALDAIKEQRAALKNFYNLQQRTKHDEIPQHKNLSSVSVADIGPSEIEDIDRFIATESYLNILKAENKVLDKLNSSKSEIKSIIYNNYYELIKINDVLEELTKPTDGKAYFESINENLNTIRSNLTKIEGCDIDIFDDLHTKKK
jgi:hypothetical protein